MGVANSALLTSPKLTTEIDSAVGYYNKNPEDITSTNMINVFYNNNQIPITSSNDAKTQLDGALVFVIMYDQQKSTESIWCLDADNKLKAMGYENIKTNACYPVLIKLSFNDNKNFALFATTSYKVNPSTSKLILKSSINQYLSHCQDDDYPMFSSPTKRTDDCTTLSFLLDDQQYVNGMKIYGPGWGSVNDPNAGHPFYIEKDSYLIKCKDPQDAVKPLPLIRLAVIVPNDNMKNYFINTRTANKPIVPPNPTNSNIIINPYPTPIINSDITSTSTTNIIITGVVICIILFIIFKFK